MPRKLARSGSRPPALPLLNPPSTTPWRCSIRSPSLPRAMDSTPCCEPIRAAPWPGGVSQSRRGAIRLRLVSSLPARFSAGSMRSTGRGWRERRRLVKRSTSMPQPGCMSTRIRWISAPGCWPTATAWHAWRERSPPIPRPQSSTPSRSSLRPIQPTRPMRVSSSRAPPSKNSLRCCRTTPASPTTSSTVMTCRPWPIVRWELRSAIRALRRRSRTHCTCRRTPTLASASGSSPSTPMLPRHARRGERGATAEELHASDYLVYAYLQLGQDRAAAKILAALPGIARNLDPGAVGAAAPPSAGYFAIAAIPARVALERGAWSEAAQLELRPSPVPFADAMTWFARALGAAHTRRHVGGAGSNRRALGHWRSALPGPRELLEPAGRDPAPWCRSVACLHVWTEG